MKVFRKLFLSVLILFTATVPSFSGISVVNDLTHLYTAVEGATYKGYVEIQNLGDGSQRVKISQKDFLCNSKGQSFYEDPVQHNRTNAHWIDLKATDILLGPKEKYFLAYEVKVPNHLELNGSYWSVVMIEPVEEVKVQTKKNTVSVLTQVNYAVQIICNTATTGKSEVMFKATEVIHLQGRKYLLVDLEDTGESYHKIMASAEFFDSKTGAAVGLFKSQLQSLFPYTSKRFTIDISDLKAGQYKGVLLANCLDNSVFGLNLTLDILDE